MRVQAGTLGRLPYLGFGSGPALVVLPGIEADTENPTGLSRVFDVAAYRAYATARTVYVVRRAPLAPGTTMADLAAELAAALTDRFTEPVDVLGISTGGSLALQLAVDHPAVVRRLALVCAACRLSDRGRAGQRRLAADLTAGRPRRGWAGIAGLMAATPAAERGWRALLWLTGRRMTPADPTDLIRTIEAEDGFDVGARLGEVRAPTLILAGARDGGYSPELFQRTAAGIPRARLLLHRRHGHAGAAMSRRVPREVLAFLARADDAGVLPGRQPESATRPAERSGRR